MKTKISFLSALVLVVLLGFYFTPKNSKADLNNSSEIEAAAGAMIFHVKYPNASGWTITIQPLGLQCTTGSTGKCVVAGVPPGTYTIVADNGHCTNTMRRVVHGASNQDVYITGPTVCY